MADIIQVRRDLAASWTSANPTLAQGELGYETDTGKMKVGDGSTAWTSLGYFEPVPSTTLDSSDIGVTVQGYDPVLDATTASFTTADETKLGGIEAGADVTDSANVDPLVDTHLNTSTATTGQYLGWNGADYAWSTVSGYTDADVNTHLNTSTALSGEVLSWNGTDYDWTTLSSGVQTNDNVVFGTVTANAGYAFPPPLKGYIGLQATTATQTISSMTLSTTGVNDASGGTLSDGDWVLLVTSWNFYGGDGGLELAVALNGTVQSATTLITTGIGETYPTILKVKKFQVSGTPTSIEFGLNNAGTLGPPADGSFSANESGMGLMLVFADEPSLANITNTSLGNGATMPGETLSSTSGAWTFSILGGYSSSGSAYTSPTATNVYNDTVATTTAGRFDVAFGYEESITTQDITGSGSAVGLVRTTFTWTQAGSGLGTAVISNGGISLDGALTENVHALSGTTVDLTPTNGTIQTHTLTGATTYTESLASGESLTLVIPGTTNTVTWPTVSWQGGTAPTLDATNDNIIALFKIGSTLYGSTVWSSSGGGGSSYTDSNVDTHLNTSTAATGEVLSWNGTDYDWIASGGGGSTDKLWVPHSTFVAPSPSTSSYAGKGLLFQVQKDVTIYGFQMTGFDMGDTQGFALKMSSSSPSTGSITAVSASSGVVSDPYAASFNQPMGRTYMFTSPVSFVTGDYISLCVFVTSGTGTSAARLATSNRGPDTYPLASEYLSYLGFTLFDDGIASAVTTGWVTNGTNTAVIAGTSVLLSD